MVYVNREIKRLLPLKSTKKKLFSAQIIFIVFSLKNLNKQKQETQPNHTNSKFRFKLPSLLSPLHSVRPIVVFICLSDRDNCVTVYL